MKRVGEDGGVLGLGLFLCLALGLLLKGVKYLRGLSLSLFSLNPKESASELFGRESEIDEFVGLVKAGRWVALLGPRMVGKTSLIKVANARLEKNGVRAVYVNLWGAKGTQGLLNALARGLNDEKGILQKIRGAAERIEGISIGPGGVSISVSKRPMATMWDLLATIGKQAGECVIELDEVQELSVISGHLLKLLANIFNTYRNVVFVFTGSMFGLMRTLLEPASTSPLYGRSPAKLYLKPFDIENSTEFLRKGFQQCGESAKGDLIGAAVERLDGIPGWLTLYGNNVAVRKLSHKKALEETVSEGVKIVRDELEHFLEGRDRNAYLATLKATATSARWNEIREAIRIRQGSTVNDGTVRNTLESLKAGMMIEETDGTYRVIDPMLRTLLLSQTLT
jgi:AAA+ ATPase superfamily predicted ATPase